MTFLVRSLAAASIAVLASCGTSRTSFTPDSGPPTVGMPAELSERERLFVREIDSTLRNQGYVPVRNGAGDLDLAFEMAEGPIRIDTTIELSERRRSIAKGYGRAAGAPLIGRSKVAEKSFNQAFEEFRSSLPDASSSGRHSGSHGGGSHTGGYDENTEYTY